VQTLQPTCILLNHVCKSVIQCLLLVDDVERDKRLLLTSASNETVKRVIYLCLWAVYHSWEQCIHWWAHFLESLIFPTIIKALLKNCWISEFFEWGKPCFRLFYLSIGTSRLRCPLLRLTNSILSKDKYYYSDLGLFRRQENWFFYNWQQKNFSLKSRHISPHKLSIPNKMCHLTIQKVLCKKCDRHYDDNSYNKKCSCKSESPIDESKGF
jgi:hypothetical protein